MEIIGKRIHINGIVQGVGFRPFVFGLAERYAVTGWVRNTSAGVDIEVDGTPPQLNAFVQALTAESPPLAQIDDMQVADIPANGFTEFEIVHSAAVKDAFQPISPDVSLCDDCLREMLDPNDRRYRYPFINCTNCGPRFTIIRDIPYDRPFTTMAPFPMCADCRREYEDPRDRRFHAQPVACPVCGPQVWLEQGEQQTAAEAAGHGEEAIQQTRQLLAEGRIVAIKGLGGFHLACDAMNETAVATLRRRKLRREKPFALMMPDLDTVARHCHLNHAERELLLSRARPIVLLRRRADSPVAAACAPGQHHLGVMLPYTPLHHLLFAPADNAPAAALPFTTLVMTSGNLSEEPIATGNDEARRRLVALADAFLLHNREIETRCDDSVVRILDLPLSSITNRQFVLPLRRSRGYAPFPVQLPWEMPPTLAAGAELKNTFCLTNGRYAFLSHHVGDLENYETLRSFEEGVAHFEKLFRVRPERLAYDLHPNYLATRYALARAERDGMPAVGVQHHHAHIAACLAENGHPGDRPVIGVSFDGTGYGEDGAIWGGEFLVAEYGGYERPFHLAYVPLPGGDKAVKEPWRIALSHLVQAQVDFGFWIDDLRLQLGRTPDFRPEVIAAVQHQIETGLNAPPTSSMGRLFDAVAALAGVRHTVNYEAQAAMELEALVDPTESEAYPFTINHLPSTINHSQFTINPAPLFHAITTDLHAQTPIPTIAARFHNGVAQIVRAVCRRLRDRDGLHEVALSGGVWQNGTLLARTVALLEQDSFTVYLHTKVPPNDGGLALGQAIVAYSMMI